jgi:hypothetical protein
MFWAVTTTIAFALAAIAILSGRAALLASLSPDIIHVSCAILPATFSAQLLLSDLLIGVTALELGFGVGTSNLRHFRLVPGLSIVQL